MEKGDDSRFEVDCLLQTVKASLPVDGGLWKSGGIGSVPGELVLPGIRDQEALTDQAGLAREVNRPKSPSVPLKPDEQVRAGLGMESVSVPTIP